MNSPEIARDNVERAVGINMTVGEGSESARASERRLAILFALFVCCLPASFLVPTFAPAADDGLVRNPFPTFQLVPADQPRVVLQIPEKVPVAPSRVQPAIPAPSGRQVPIGLDTVLRLAEEQNPQVAIARSRLDEAFAEKNVAAYKWLPDMYVGTSWYRHEGGIQNEDGTLTHSSTGAMFAGMEMSGRFDVHETAYQQVNAQRKVWQQRGELSRVTSEVLLEASTTYIDLLSAKTGEAVARELGDKLVDLLDRSRKLASTEPAAGVQVARIQAELDGVRQMALKLHAQAAGAQAKLGYLLALDPDAELILVDRRLVSFDLVDAGQPVCELVQKAMASGPGMKEMQGILQLIEDSIAKSRGMMKYMPQFEMRMAEGGFGAGPGDSMNWDNRWEVGIQARWNLTEFLTVKDRKRISQAKANELNLNYQELRGKLTAGVWEARETILVGHEQIELGQAQIRNATNAFDLSYLRLKEAFQPSSYTEALLAIDALAKAKANYIQAISAYDKAELRLMVLIGPSACHAPTPAR